MATVSGTVSDFDQAAYKTSMASILDGVSAEDITLTVAAASVIVTAEIAALNETVAESPNFLRMISPIKKRKGTISFFGMAQDTSCSLQ